MITRPLLRYHGGKWKLAPWIIGYFPEHRIYVEPFGGGASVLLRKHRSYSEVYNDLDGEIVNLFRVVRDRGDELSRALSVTPFSRVDFDESYESSEDPIEQARRTLVRSHMGFGSNFTRPTLSGRPMRKGFRSCTTRRGSTPAGDWNSIPENLAFIIERFRGVVIENRPAMHVMEQHDTMETLHYVDPPYLPETRDKGCDYRHELTMADHEELAIFLRTLKGAVIVSGYPSNLYEKLYQGWARVERASFADGAKKRTEVLWMRNCELAPVLPFES